VGLQGIPGDGSLILKFVWATCETENPERWVGVLVRGLEDIKDVRSSVVDLTDASS